MLGLLVAGLWLSMTAGFVNAVVLVWVGIPVSHMSGAVSHLSIDLAGQPQSMWLVVVSIMAGFMLGAIASGAIIGNRGFYLGGHYGVALIIESVLLLAAGVLGWRGQLLAVPLASMACGLQNAMAGSFRGLVLRTTHITGVVTDLGMILGQRLRRHPVSPYQTTMLTILLLGFIAGGLLGTVSGGWLGPVSIALPAGPCMIVGVSYLIWRVRNSGTGGVAKPHA